MLAFGSYSKTYNNVGASQVINTSEFASSLYAQIPNAKSGTGTITTTTYNGSSNLGSTSVTFTANAVEANVNPTVNALTYSVDSTTSGLAGNSTTFIANVTTATIRVPIASRSSATLATAFIWYYNGTTKVELARQNASGSSGTYTFSVAPANIKNGIYGGAIDSRGYVTYNTTNKAPATYKDYVVLTADQSAQIARTNQTEPKVKITQFKGNYWSGNFGSQANTLTVQWRYKEGISSTWSSYYTIPAANVSISGSTYTISNYTLTDGTTQELFNYQKAGSIQFAVTDKIGTKNSSYAITAGVPNFAIFPSHVLFNENYVNKLQADLAFNEKNQGFTANDWDNAPGQKGKYMGSNKTNSPTARTTSGWWYVDQHLHLDSYRKQIAYAFNNDNNNIYVRDKSGGTWSNWDAVKTETTMHYNPDIPTTGVWTRVCRVNFYEHVQGEFCYLRIYISPGQNGRDNQNAYIDLVMQLGYTGDNGGRAGCNAELHAFNSVYTLSNTNIKVIAGSNTDYYVWVYTSYAYNRVNYTANSGVNCNIWDAFTTQSSEPTGTACNLEYRNNGMAVGSVGTDHYIKYDSGIMECFGTFGGTYNITNAYGSGFYYSMPNHSFAQAFKWAPQLNVTVYSATGLFSYSINSLTASEFKGFIWTCNSASNQACQIHYHATGYWK